MQNLKESLKKALNNMARRENIEKAGAALREASDNFKSVVSQAADQAGDWWRAHQDDIKEAVGRMDELRKDGQERLNSMAEKAKGATLEQKGNLEAFLAKAKGAALDSRGELRGMASRAEGWLKDQRGTLQAGVDKIKEAINEKMGDSSKSSDGADSKIDK